MIQGASSATAMTDLLQTIAASKVYMATKMIDVATVEKLSTPGSGHASLGDEPYNVTEADVTGVGRLLDVKL